MQLTKINGKYELFLPEHRASRPQWDIKNGGWEVKRIEAMITTIRNTTTLQDTQIAPVVFDIGTEEGDISAILMKYTDCEMVLFEPNDRVFPCIKAIWEANNLRKPLRFFPGFLSDKCIPVNEKGTPIMPMDVTFEEFNQPIISDHGFKQAYENYPDVAQITLDKYVNITGIVPDVITMDVEGFEQCLIRGAEQTLRKYKPTIFMSVHPEFMYESYRNEGKWKEMYGERQHVVHMLRFIDELGYTHECIEYDYHELHLKFIPL